MRLSHPRSMTRFSGFRRLGLAGGLAMAAACGDDVPSTGGTTEASTGDTTSLTTSTSDASTTTGSSSSTTDDTTTSGSDSTFTSEGSSSSGEPMTSTGSGSGEESTTSATAVCDPMDIGSEVGIVAMGTTETAGDGVHVPCMKFDSVDLEFLWTAPVAGAYQIDLLGSDYDTAIMILDGDCDGEQLACNDDFDDLQSAVLVNLVADQTIVIVVDGYGGASGEFVLNIGTAEATDCCEASVFGGCGDMPCQDAVCAISDECCTDVWSSSCASAIAPVVCEQCAPDMSCCFAHDGMGCADKECSAEVCAIDDTCCSMEWTQACADMAVSTCLSCTPGGDCCEPHVEPGCSVPSCEQAVCAIDSFCCKDQWYDYCADYADQYCGGICVGGGGTDSGSSGSTSMGFIADTGG